MTKVLKKIREKKIYYYFILIIVSLIASIPLIRFQIKLSDDGFIHILRIIGMDSILKNGEFPPFIEPNYCNNWGYAINLFYPSLVTYGPLLFKVVTNSFYNALKLYTLATILISSFTMYKCTKEITDNNEIALLAGIIYTLFPYRLETIYDRFAIGEFSSYMFLPLVFLGLYNLVNKDGKKHYYISIGAIGLILTHTITTEYTAIFSFIYLLFNIKKLKNKEIIKKIFINVVIILGITAFFTIPIMEHKILGEYTIFNSGIMSSTGIDVQSQTIKFAELFIDMRDDYVSFKIGFPIIFLILLSFEGYKKIEDNKTYVLFLFFAVISIIMCLNIFCWIFLPDFLCTLQYPWRMLEFFGFFASIICAINAYTIIKKLPKINTNLVLLCAIVLIIVLSIPMVARYKIEDKDLNIDEIYETKITSNMKISHYSINREYLPLKANSKQRTYMLERKDNVYVLEGSSVIENEIKNNLNLSFEIKNTQEGTILELPYLYYLGYESNIEYSNGTIVKLQTFESENGFVTIRIPGNIEKATVNVQYKGTKIEKIGYIISGFTIICCTVYIFLSRKRRKIEGKYEK